MSTLGPRFSMSVRVPEDWNRPGLVSPTQVAVQSLSGDEDGWILEVQSEALRTRLRSGQVSRVFLAQVIREDSETLFAFESPQERALFLELCQLDSVGPKTAAQILSSVSLSDLSAMVHGRVPATLKIPGVGAKTLEKLKVGLKVGQDRFLRLLGPSSSAASAAAETIAPGGEWTLLVDALERLGMRPQDTVRLCQELSKNDPAFGALALGDQVRRVLQAVGRSSGRIHEVKA